MYSSAAAAPAAPLTFGPSRLVYSFHKLIMNDPTEEEEEGIGLAPLCAHPAVSEFQSIVSARKNMRCALDGHLYTINEFQAYYGEAAAESIWQSAPHFIQLGPQLLTAMLVRLLQSFMLQ